MKLSKRFQRNDPGIAGILPAKFVEGQQDAGDPRQLSLGAGMTFEEFLADKKTRITRIN